MNTEANRKPELDDVLDEFASIPGPPDGETLRDFIQEYPQFERELIEFATDWIATDAGRNRDPISEESVNRIVNRTASRVQTILDAEERSPKITNLAADIGAAGHDFHSFERAVGIDRLILDSLIARLVVPATLPARLVTAVAAALKRTADEFREYILMPPQFAAASKSRGRPIAKQADFAMFVRDSNLPEAERTKWLAEPPDPKLAA